jgi:uncharacterized protein YdeI (YjbR/CyaY-like superfamily)
LVEVRASNIACASGFALIHRLGAVKRQETRERKIREFVEMLARHETPYPQKRRPAGR